MNRSTTVHGSRNLSGTEDRGVTHRNRFAACALRAASGSTKAHPARRNVRCVAFFVSRTEAPMTELQHTPLHAAHLALNARMVDFGGWDMPVNYGSQIDEHRAVRTDAGMFDVSHMRVVDFEGDAVREFFKHAIANNVDKLTTPGKALYSCLLNEQRRRDRRSDRLLLLRNEFPRRRERGHGGEGHRLVRAVERRRQIQSFDHAAPRSRDHRRARPERARKDLASAAGHARANAGHQAVQRGRFPVDANMAS